MKVFDDFIKFLGFSDFNRSAIKIQHKTLSTKVSIDDRLVFVSVIENDDCYIGKCIIADKKYNVLDIIVFELKDDEWVEVE